MSPFRQIKLVLKGKLPQPRPKRVPQRVTVKLIERLMRVAELKGRREWNSHTSMMVFFAALSAFNAWSGYYFLSGWWALNVVVEGRHAISGVRGWREIWRSWNEARLRVITRIELEGK